MEGLTEIFDKSRLTTAASRIADVASNHTYTIIGDINHTHAAPYEIVARPETMHALASAGVKHIATEMLMPMDQPVLDAYYKGEISDRTMKYVIDKMAAPSLTQDGLGLDDTHQRNAYYALIQNAKKEGIQVHGINGSEGVMPPEQIGPVNDLLGQMKYTMAMAIEENPDFFKMGRLAQGRFMTKELYDAGFKDDEVKAGLAMTGFRKQNFLDLDDEQSMKDMIIARLAGDPSVADRIKDVTGGEKSLVIYGHIHLVRPLGDIDAGLPGSAVIDIYTDQTDYNASRFPMIKKFADEMGMDFTDRPDYELDIKTGKWTNAATGEVSTVAIPALPSMPEVAQRAVQVVPNQTPAQPVPEIKF